MQRLSLILIALIRLETAALAKVNVILIHQGELLIADLSLGRKCVCRKVRGSLSHRPDQPQARREQVYIRTYVR
jgi:hypothetical protein